MNFYKHERLLVLIDGLHLRSTERALGFRIDFNRLRSRFQTAAQLLRIIYYTPHVLGLEDDPMRPLLDWLAYNGYQVVARPARQFIDDEGRGHIRGDARVALAVDAMDLAPTADHIVLIAGHGDFAHLVEALKRQGKGVTVLSSTQSLVADELRRQADQFVEFGTLVPDLGHVPEPCQVGGEETQPSAEAANPLPANVERPPITVEYRKLGSRVPGANRASKDSGT